MRFEDWERYYKAILSSMEYDRDRDEVVAHQLSSLLAERESQLVPPGELKSLIKDTHVFVFGDGPSLVEDIAGFEFKSLTIAADGELARSECRAIRTAIGTLTDDLLPGPSIELLLARLEEALAQQGPEARLEAVASRFALERPEAEAAFSLAAAVALSDDHVADAESALIDKLRRYFGIPAARAAAATRATMRRIAG